MSKALVPIHYTSTPAATAAFGRQLPEIAVAAFLEIGRVSRGYAIHHHQFRVKGAGLVAVASRVKLSGVVEIEIDVGHSGIPARTFTAEDAAIAGRKR